MAATISIEEGVPAAWPPVEPENGDPISVSPESDEQRFLRMAWQRVEAWIAARWGVRSCAFIVEGPGEWVPPLRPFALPDTIEVWAGDVWVTTTVAPSPLGYVLDTLGPYRFIGDLGTDGTPPQAVREGVWRLAQYFEAADVMSARDRAIVRKSFDLAGLRVEEERSTAWIARAMQQSGAADLLRPWRNLGGR